jgi:Uma2 family endonuclease
MTRAATPPTRMRFTRADYHRMAAAGIIPPDARVELLDGEVIRMSPIGPTHSAAVALLDRFLQSNVGDRALCRVQSPLALDEHSEPEPDLVLVRPRADSYRGAHPGPADVLLLIEVAESSVALDRGQKATLYAQAGIQEYWLIDLTRNVLVVHRDPTGDRYASAQEHDASARVSPAAFADVVLELEQILSP